MREREEYLFNKEVWEKIVWEQLEANDSRRMRNAIIYDNLQELRRTTMTCNVWDEWKFAFVKANINFVKLNKPRFKLYRRKNFWRNFWSDEMLYRKLGVNYIARKVIAKPNINYKLICRIFMYLKS